MGVLLVDGLMVGSYLASGNAVIEFLEVDVHRSDVLGSFYQFEHDTTTIYLAGILVHNPRESQYTPRNASSKEYSDQEAAMKPAIHNVWTALRPMPQRMPRIRSGTLSPSQHL